MNGVDHLTHGALPGAPVPCRGCMWWQTRPGGRSPDRLRWATDVEDEFGPWGKLYLVDGVATGLIQYGPAGRFPRAATLPAGPPNADAALITCAYLVDAHSPWVLQSLFLAAIGECKDRGYPALETFGYRHDVAGTFSDRFLRHRTIFPSDFLRDLGFQNRRSAGRIELARLDLRGIVPVAEPGRLARLRARLALVNPTPAGAG